MTWWRETSGLTRHNGPEEDPDAGGPLSARQCTWHRVGLEAMRPEAARGATKLAEE